MTGSYKFKTITDFTDFLQKISDNDYILFFGAGISINSGIPLVNNLKYEILESIGMTQYYEALLETPFELFMEFLIGFSGSDEILNIFNLGEPTLFHKFTSFLLKNKKLKTLLTTNFDMLIEKASITDGVDLNSLFREDDFKVENVFSQTYIKIHGSIEDKETTRIFMYDISIQEKIKKRKQLLDYIFKLSKEKYIIVLGYSCSDYFDIVPYLKDVNNSNKTIFYINHSMQNDFSVDKLTECFSTFKGVNINCNTDELIQKWYSGFTKRKIEKSVNKTNWENYCKELPSHFKDKVKSMIFVAALLQQRNLFTESSHVFEDILKNHRVEKKQKIEIYNALSFNTYNLIKQGNIPNTNDKYTYVLESIDLAKEINNNRLLKSAYSKYSKFLLLDKDFDGAIKIFEDIDDILPQITEGKEHKVGDNPDYMIATHNNSRGDLFIEMYKENKEEKFLLKAESYYNKTYDFFENHGGFMLEKGIANFNLVIINREKRNVKKALEYLLKAKEIAKNVGDTEGIKMCKIVEDELNLMKKSDC